MKRFLGLCLLIIMVSSAFGCRERRDFDESALRNVAEETYFFETTYFFKMVDEDTANLLIGEPYRLGGVLVGEVGGIDKVLFIPRYQDEPIRLLNFFYPFTMDEITSKVFSLTDDDGNALSSYFEDFGAMYLDVSTVQAIRDARPDMTITTEIVMTFYTDILTFYVVSDNGLCTILNQNYETVTL